MMKNIRNAITYPVMMVGMLLIVLFVFVYPGYAGI